MRKPPRSGVADEAEKKRVEAEALADAEKKSIEAEALDDAEKKKVVLLGCFPFFIAYLINCLLD